MSSLSDLYFKKILVTEDSSLDQWHAQQLTGQSAIQSIMDQFNKLSVQDKQVFLKAINTTAVTPGNTDTAAVMATESLISPVSRVENIATRYGFPAKDQPALGATNKVKVKGIPPGVGEKYFNAKVGGIYRIVDRNLETVTITGDDGKKLILPKGLVEFVNG